MKTKKIFKRFSLLLALIVVTVSICSTGFTASAAYVTDGENFYTAGDVDENGTVDICDLVQAHIGNGNITAADLDGDGEVASYDYALIRAMLLGIDKSQWSE